MRIRFDELRFTAYPDGRDQSGASTRSLKDLAGRPRERWRSSRRAALGDALLYAAAAAFAAHSLRSSELVDYRTWAAFAWPAYAAGALAAVALCCAGASLGARRVLVLRVLIAVLLLIGALAAPLAAEVHWRVERGPKYAPSEVVITEGAASHLLHGRNPYSNDYRLPELAGRTPGTAKHYAYLPAMAIFGLPRALWPDTRWTDARMPLALMVGVIVTLALALWHAAHPLRLRAFQLLLVLPTGAPLVVTGSSDIAVLALSFLGLVLLYEARQAACILTVAVAASLKLTAWPLLLALMVSVPEVRGARHGRNVLMLAPALVVVVVAAGLVAGPASFAADVILFPLGLTPQPSPASTDTLGTLLLTSFDNLPRLSVTRALIITALLALALGLAAAVLVFAMRAGGRRTPPAPRAAVGAAGMLTVLILLAPTGRSGYFIYPIDLVLLAMLMRPSIRSPEARQLPAS